MTWLNIVADGTHTDPSDKEGETAAYVCPCWHKRWTGTPSLALWSAAWSKGIFFFSLRKAFLERDGEVIAEAW